MVLVVWALKPQPKGKSTQSCGIGGPALNAVPHRTIGTGRIENSQNRVLSIEN